FQREWLKRLASRPGRALSVREEAELEGALEGTWALAPGSRRLSRLVEFLDPTDPDGPRARLKRWCVETGGEYGWVFDAPEDRIVGQLAGNAIVAFDVTEFLDLPEVRGPLTAYLFHLVRQRLDGRRLVVWMDEFAKLLA